MFISQLLHISINLSTIREETEVESISALARVGSGAETGEGKSTIRVQHQENALNVAENRPNEDPERFFSNNTR